MVNFYWYPKCSTCKKAKIWLDENNVTYNTIDMIETPPTKEQLAAWMAESDLPIRFRPRRSEEASRIRSDAD